MPDLVRPAVAERSGYFDLRPRTVRILSVVGLTAVWLQFLLEQLPAYDRLAALRIGAGVVKIIANACILPVFLSSYAYVATNAPTRSIDERELAQRYRAHFYAYQSVLLTLLLPWAWTELARTVWHVTPGIGVISGFLWALIDTALILPATLLAFWDRDA